METSKHVCDTCTTLVRLCSGLDYFPADIELRRLLVERLHRLAVDHDHATAMIERWLERETAAPKVADLVALAAEVKTKQELPAGCDICGGDPWILTKRGAARCGCGRGRVLRDADRRRAESAARPTVGTPVHMRRIAPPGATSECVA
jgi:hypothetical protein